MMLHTKVNYTHHDQIRYDFALDLRIFSHTMQVEVPEKRLSFARVTEVAFTTECVLVKATSVTRAKGSLFFLETKDSPLSLEPPVKPR